MTSLLNITLVVMGSCALPIRIEKKKAAKTKKAMMEMRRFMTLSKAGISKQAEHGTDDRQHQSGDDQNHDDPDNQLLKLLISHWLVSPPTKQATDYDACNLWPAMSVHLSGCTGCFFNYLLLIEAAGFSAGLAGLELSL